MQDNFSLKVNDEYEFSLTPKDAEELDVLALDKTNFHLLKDHESYKIKMLDSNFHQKKYAVEVNGNLYQVDISDALDQLIKDLGFEVGEGKKVNAVHAPMPGLIFDIMVNVGDEVTEGQSLLILEAMKMENVISSPRDGVIKEIHVSKGQAIEKKYLMIEFE